MQEEYNTTLAIFTFSHCILARMKNEVSTLIYCTRFADVPIITLLLQYEVAMRVTMWAGWSGLEAETLA